MTFRRSNQLVAVLSLCLAMSFAASGCFRSADPVDGHAADQSMAGSGGIEDAGPIDTDAWSESACGAKYEPDSGAADGGKAPLPDHSMEIVVDNRGPGVALLGDECYGEWGSVRLGDKKLNLGEGCFSSCEEYDDFGGIACTAECRNTRELLVPGTRASKTWDGYERSFDRKECYTLATFAQGKELVASACYDIADLGTEPTCAETTFGYGDEEVIVKVEPKAKPAVSTEITLKNDTGVAIEIVVDHCGSEAWLDLGEKDQKISRNVFCACECDADFKPGACPSCGQCADDVTKTIAPGASYTTSWDGNFWYSYESGCSERYAMPRLYPVTFELCYKKAGDSDETCVQRQPYEELGTAQIFNVE